MSTVPKKIIRTILGLTIGAFLPAMVHSYVLDGPHIIQLMTEKLGQAKSLYVSQRVIFHKIQLQSEALPENHRSGGAKDAEAAPGEQPSPDEIIASPDGSETIQAATDGAGGSGEQPSPDETAVSPGESETIQLDESLRYVFSEAFRSDIVSDSNQRVYIFNQGRTITVIDGVISDAVESRFDLYKDLLLYRSRNELTDRLSELGIDVTVSSLGRFDGQLALVIGAEFPDESVSQVWIDKETFHPLRMIVTGATSPYSNSKAYLEIRYSGWQKIGQIWYPMRIEFLQDGKTVREIEVDDYQLNPNFSKGIFDIAHLKSEYLQPVMKPDHTGENEGLSEVQKTIEEFKKIFE
jgi:hypothetical protein